MIGVKYAKINPISVYARARVCMYVYAYINEN